MRHLILASAILATISSPSSAWGLTGHRITGPIADKILSSVARARVQLLIGEDNMAEASTWPDDMLSDPAEFW